MATCNISSILFLFGLDESPLKVGGDRRSRYSEPVVRSSSGLSRGLDVELSPWSTVQSLQTSEDVAQLLVSFGSIFTRKAPILSSAAA